MKTKALLLAALTCMAMPGAFIDTSITWGSGGCFFRFIDQDGNAAVSGDCNGVPIGTPVNAITVGFNPYVAEPDAGPNLYTPPPPIQMPPIQMPPTQMPPTAPGSDGDDHGGGPVPAPEPSYAIGVALAVGLCLTSFRRRNLPKAS